MKPTTDSGRHLMTAEEERDPIASTARGEWRSIGDIDQRREILRAAALRKLEEIDRPQD